MKDMFEVEHIRNHLQTLRRDVHEAYRFISEAVRCAKPDALRETLRRKGMSRFRANLLVDLMILLGAADLTAHPSDRGEAPLEVWISAGRISASELASKLNSFGRNVMDAYILIVRTQRKYGSAWRRWIIKALERKGVDDRAAELILDFLLMCGVIYEPHPGVVKRT
ncbi:TPA: hypothetical protein EYP37_13520 [Candidatus Poribacteria bacterium]|nr:hypothetical protein [Candidatus Poribacteria bacterium]